MVDFYVWHRRLPFAWLQTWEGCPLADYLDVRSLIPKFEKLGVVLHPAPQLSPLPNLANPEEAFPEYPYPGV